jgi:hypothetical protein
MPNRTTSTKVGLEGDVVGRSKYCCGGGSFCLGVDGHFGGVGSVGNVIIVDESGEGFVFERGVVEE